MYLLYSIIIVLFVFYGCLIIFYWRSWKSIPLHKADQFQPSTYISVVIAARNEEKNIERLLNALTSQDYPGNLTELIVVDDHSTDRTAEIIQQFPMVKLVKLNDDHLNSYKKKAIQTGIASSNGSLIVTTDADCNMGAQWLSQIASIYQQSSVVFVAAPVVMEDAGGLLGLFQTYDFAILQGITGASVHKGIHSMSNGANMAYTKSAFENVNGFTGIDSIASGDDLLLMHKILQQNPRSAVYLKSLAAIVSTAPMYSWKQFLNQRIRWASKATHYKDTRIFIVLLLVYLFNLSFLALLIGGLFNSQLWLAALILWVAKTLVEFPFVQSVLSFFSKSHLLKYFFFLQPLHIGYTVVSGLLGQFGKYEWKGRRVK